MVFLGFLRISYNLNISLASFLLLILFFAFLFCFSLKNRFAIFGVPKIPLEFFRLFSYAPDSANAMR